MTQVTPQYNFSYGADSSQPPLPSGGFYNLWTPDQVLSSSSNGWTTGTFGLGGLIDTFYYQPGFKLGDSAAGGCSWNNAYDIPPSGTYWYYGVGGTYQLFPSGYDPILRSLPAVGTVYQSASQQVAGSGIPLYGFGAEATWNPSIYPGQSPHFIGAMYYASNSCAAGDTEYGFAHYNDTQNQPTEQFYFYLYSNCKAPSGSLGQQAGFACDLTNGQPIDMNNGAGQCSAAANFILPANTHGNYWWFWWVNVYRGISSYWFTFGITDPYTNQVKQSCNAYPASNPIFPSSCTWLQPGATQSWSCKQPFPTWNLFGGLGSVTVGIINKNNTQPNPPRANPMIQMTGLYVQK